MLKIFQEGTVCEDIFKKKEINSQFLDAAKSTHCLRRPTDKYKPQKPQTTKKKKKKKRVLVLGYKSLVITAANLYIYIINIP